MILREKSRTKSAVRSRPFGENDSERVWKARLAIRANRGRSPSRGWIVAVKKTLFENVG